MASMTAKDIRFFIKYYDVTQSNVYKFYCLMYVDVNSDVTISSSKLSIEYSPLEIVFVYNVNQIQVVVT